MKIVKLKKSDYTQLEKMLERAGLVNKEQKIAYPDLLYVNQRTYNEIKAALKREFKKQYPYLRSSKLEASVGYHMLNLGPNVLENKQGGNNLPVGYAIILKHEERVMLEKPTIFVRSLESKASSKKVGKKNA